MCSIEMWDFNNCLQTIRYKTVYHSTVVGTTLIRLFKMKYYKHIAFNWGCYGRLPHSENQYHPRRSRGWYCCLFYIFPVFGFTIVAGFFVWCFCLFVFVLCLVYPMLTVSLCCVFCLYNTKILSTLGTPDTGQRQTNKNTIQRYCQH
jgi:hypothetical protein